MFYLGPLLEVWLGRFGNRVFFFSLVNYYSLFVFFSQDLLQIRSYVYAEEPNIDIHNFIGTFTRVSARIIPILSDIQPFIFNLMDAPHE